MRDKLSAAPQALICGDCFKRHSEDSHEFYCEHNQVWAIRRDDGGWVLSTRISPEYHRAILDDARRLQALEESGGDEAAARVH